MPRFGRNTPFVGRQRELAVLRERLDEAASGRGGVVLVAGEPGVGKTRLVQEFACQVPRDDWRVLYGRANDLDASPPYLPIAEALGAYILASPAEDLRHELGDGAAEVALVAPELRKRLPGIAPSPAAGAVGDRHRLFESICAFFLTIARSAPRGLLLILDDLHWADQPTLRFLVHLARKLSDSPLLLVATYRTVGLNHAVPLLEALADLSREETAGRLPLARLSVEETAALVEQTWGRAAEQTAIDALYRRTEGNPFFAKEILHELRAEGRTVDSLGAGLAELQVPEGVRQVISMRLARLSQAANRLLEACAVIGDGVDFEVLAAVCEGDEAALLDALGEAIDAGMLREEGERYHLAHALVRQTVDGGILAPRKRRLHRQAAEAIERIHVEDLNPFLGSLALHYRLAGGSAGPEKAVDYAERAAVASLAVFAYEEAAHHLKTALELVERRAGDTWLQRRAELLTRHGTLLFNSGLDWAGGVARLEEAARLHERLGRRAEAALAHIRLGQFQSGMPATLDVPRAMEEFRTAEATLGQQASDAILADLSIGLAEAAFRGVQTDEGLAASRRALALAEELEHEDLRAWAAGLHAFHLLASGEIAEGLTRLEQAWEMVARLDQVRLSHQVSIFGGNFLRTLGAPNEARIWFRRGLIELERGRAAPGLRENVRSRFGETLLAAGEIAEARRLLGEADIERKALPSVSLAARVALAEGDWAKAESIAVGLRALCRRTGDRHDEWYALEVLARCSRVQGQADQAAAQIQDALQIGVDGGRLVFELAARAELAMLAAQAKRPDEAESHLHRCRAILANGEDWRGLAARVALAEAVALAAAGRLRRAEERFASAVESCRRHGVPWHEAEALQLWGLALASAGERARGTEMLAAARRCYERMGAGSPWLESIDALVQRLALTRRSTSSSADGLTARELEVLGLLAAGESNREIAACLLLSPRTVERHVASIYGKIGARRRADATAYALRHGLDRVPAR